MQTQIYRSRMHPSRFHRNLSLPVKACLLFLAFMPLAFVFSCDDQRSQTVTWTEFEPVYMSHKEFIAAARSEDARDLKEIRHIKDIRTYDVIPNNGVLIVTGGIGSGGNRTDGISFRSFGARGIDRDEYDAIDYRPEQGGSADRPDRDGSSDR